VCVGGGGIVEGWGKEFMDSEEKTVLAMGGGAVPKTPGILQTNFFYFSIFSPAGSGKREISGKDTQLESRLPVKTVAGPARKNKDGRRTVNFSKNVYRAVDFRFFSYTFVLYSTVHFFILLRLCIW
jgi:hypothetical protein